MSALAAGACLALLSPGAASATPAGDVPLPARVRRIVLHVPGGPSYERPERRWAFFTPRETQRLWRPRFGAHWIVWTDGSLWPRHTRGGDPEALVPPVDLAADEAWRLRIASGAAPVYAHVRGANEDSVGIEVSHSGRADEPFPEVQVRSLAWLLRTLLEIGEGRLSTASISGHKDLDRRPAYVGCERAGCPFFADAQGRAYRRRVDPPESLFLALARYGLNVPRPGPEGDLELERAERIPEGTRPEVQRP